MSEIWVYGIIGSILVAAVGKAYSATLKAAELSHSLDLVNKEVVRLREQLEEVQHKKDELRPEASNTDTSSLEHNEAYQLQRAEKAKKLGHELCHCTYPPQVMNSVAPRVFVCPRCNNKANLNATVAFSD